jgi:5-methylthioadenosine/S-adenosylhomocysteine deaminase
MSSADLHRLAARGCTLVTCPRSNGYTGAGAPPIAEFYRSGVRVAIGTDSLASCADLNMFAELATMRALAPHVSPAALVESATIQGARALGFDADYGTIEPGKRADLVIRTTEVAEVQPGVGVAQSIVLSGRSRSVDTVLVDGQVVLRGGCSTRLDERSVYGQARTSLARVLHRSGIRPQPRWTPIQ